MLNRILLPVCVSALVLFALYEQGLSERYLGLVTLSYLAWLVSLYSLRRRRQPSGLAADSGPTDEAEENSLDPVVPYYVNLLSSLAQGYQVYQVEHQQARERIDRVILHLGRAQDLARNTGLLAVNAMTTASRCGEVGRGFASVSKDLINISERSDKDLSRLLAVAQGVGSILGSHKPESLSRESWADVNPLLTNEKINSEPFGHLKEVLQGFENNIQQISKRYAQTSEMDVRWLQLGEAIRRVVSEMSEVVAQMLAAVDRLLADLCLIDLAEPLSEPQLLEIKKRLFKMEGLANNFGEFQV